MSATHSGTCPICHRQQKIVRGGMAKHGYRRPNGWHQEVGGCWGTGKTPWEVSPKDAVRYIAEVLNPAAATKREYAASVDAGTEKTLYFSHYRGVSVAVTAESITATRDGKPVPASAEGWESELKRREYTAEWQALSTWDRARKSKAAEIRRIADAIETEAKFLQRQIDGWKPGTLHEVAQDPKPTIGFEVAEGQQVIVRTARAGLYGQTRYEVWNGKGWIRAAIAAISPLLKAGKARWLAPGEKIAATAAATA